MKYLQDDADVVDDECKPLDKLFKPELDDDEVLITLADDDVVQLRVLFGVDGCDANRALANNTGPSTIGWGCAFGVLECEQLASDVGVESPGLMSMLS